MLIQVGYRSRVSGVVVLLLLVAFALRMYRLDYFSLRGDESFTVLFVQKPFAQMWNEIRTVEPNPPLIYLLLRGWIALAGSGEFATRYFSAFWGVLCVPLVYRLAREVFSASPASPHSPYPFSPLLNFIQERGEGSPKGGVRGEALALIAAFLLAINPYQIWHSQDVRNYTMWPALSLLALIFFWRWIKGVYGGVGMARYGSRVESNSAPLPHTPAHAHLHANSRALLWFTLAELAALYTHYYEAFILLALNLFVALFLWRRWAVLLRWAGAQLVLAALYLPWVFVFSNRASSYGEGSGRQGVPLWEIWQRTLSAFTLGETLDAGLRNLAWIPFALALALILIGMARRERWRASFFLLYAGVPTLAVFVLNLTRPLFLERYLNGIAPAYYLLFAYGIVELVPIRSTLLMRLARSFALAVFVALAALALANYFYDPVYAKSPDWRAVAQVIHSQRQPGDLILQNFPETSLVYYDTSRLPLVVYPRDFFPTASDERALAALNAKYQRIWFLPAAPDFWDPDQAVQQWLDRHADLLAEPRTSPPRLKLYSTPSQFLKTLQPLDLNVGQFARLLGYRVEQQGTTLRVVLYWRALATTPASYTGFVHLLDAEGRLLSQQDHPPVSGAYPTNQWRKDELIVDAYQVTSNARGTTLEIGMYDPATIARLPIADAQGQPRGDVLKLPLSP